VARRNVSKPQSLLAEIIAELFPTYKLSEEFHIGDRLRLDIFIKDIGLACEYMGRQHREYVPHFHRTIEEFRNAVQRDKDKAVRCVELSICLVVFADRETLDRETIKQKIEAAIAQHDFTNYDSSFLLDTYKRRRKDKIKEHQKERGHLAKTEREKKQEDLLKIKARLARQESYRRQKEWKRKHPVQKL